MTILEEAQEAVQNACYRQGVDALYLNIKQRIKREAESRCMDGTEYLALMLTSVDQAYLETITGETHA